jgi:1-phosphatidylinositol phosphodiesterase
VGGNNWMSSIESSRQLSDLTIPGTHDSMAFYEPVAGTAKCQSMPLDDQLYAGVRFLDIRCRHYGDSFVIHHGSIYQKANFDDVLNRVIAFLNANPSEAVIMSVKEEHTPANNTRSFEQTFDSYVQKNPGKWNLGTGIPTLGEARGKITLFRRYGGSARGINATGWADKATFSTGSIRVQDNYAVSSTNTKWNQIKGLLDEAYSGSASTMYVNFASGVGSIFGIPNITGVSRPINQKVNSFFTGASGRYGIIVADFIDYPYAAKIYNANSQ